MSLISWHSSRLKRLARSSSAAETQAATDGDDEAVYLRLCLKQVLLDSWMKLSAKLAKQAIGSEKNSCRSGGTVVVSTMPWLALRPLVMA